MIPRSVAELIASGRRDFVHFWGETPRSPGVLDESCLSQWWRAPFTVDGLVYPTAEHWMMAAKARLFGDAEAETKILAAGHPREAKDLGRTVRGFDRERWLEHRVPIVAEGNLHKFGQHHDLRAFLRGTGDRILVEASPVDLIWGIGHAADQPGASDPTQWRGLNLLGFALMAVRDRLALAA
ncbi:NADAR family protein [Kribbella deserti]|uniref:NADAR family protein n=1 Tax=Kribbella deserti TaxID=1926257 RepID=A0ABV6QPK2_9ACTN